MKIYSAKESSRLGPFQKYYDLHSTGSVPPEMNEDVVETLKDYSDLEHVGWIVAKDNHDLIAALDSYETLPWVREEGTEREFPIEIVGGRVYEVEFSDVRAMLQ